MRHCARIALRGYAYAAVTVLAIFTYAPEAWSRSPRPARCEQMTAAKAKALFAEWNNALQQTPDKVVQTYTPEAVLLPTFENGPLVGRDQIRGYFVHFLEQHPFGRIDTQNVVRAGCNVGVVAGLYTFTVDGEPPAKARADKPARYTYVYVFTQDGKRGRWLISHHHSSARPK